MTINNLFVGVTLGRSLAFGVRWVVYGPENWYNLPYPRLLTLKRRG